MFPRWGQSLLGHLRLPKGVLFVFYFLLFSTLYAFFAWLPIGYICYFSYIIFVSYYFFIFLLVFVSQSSLSAPIQGQSPMLLFYLVSDYEQSPMLLSSGTHSGTVLNASPQCYLSVIFLFVVLLGSGRFLVFRGVLSFLLFLFGWCLML